MYIEAFGKELHLVNDEKADRAIHGTLGPKGVPQGGVGESATPEQVVTEYDRLGGLVKLEGDIVDKGCFWNFPGRAPQEKPKIMLSFNINGKRVSVPADEPLPVIVRAAKMAEQGAEVKEEEKEPAPRKTSSLIGVGRKEVKKTD